MDIKKAELFQTQSSVTSDILSESTEKAGMGSHSVDSCESDTLVAGQASQDSSAPSTLLSARKTTSFKDVMTYFYKGFVGLCCGSVPGGIAGGFIGGAAGLALGILTGGLAVIPATVAGATIGATVVGSVSGGATAIANIALHHIDRLHKRYQTMP
ncbi:hypothetical protein [Sansalvadorimonas verongulae]|uniref:hypothetical protein n=1 Tax=Sansalvadorimonas verongulae TaxID=2172824 RepID=UPI0012BC4E7E|nr:hypothetical protein [Sansalvadorimonas verongulae]MTI12245.1 hypothetical protein [Sansalvadorimonas verongulae]